MHAAPAVPIRLAAVVVLTAAGLLAASGRAAAGCGDYVSVVDATPDVPDHPASPAPCHGPGCSNQPAPADLPLTAPVAPPGGPDQWADARRGSDPEDPARAARRAIPAGDGRAVHLPRPVFHPPRAA